MSAIHWRVRQRRVSQITGERWIGAAQSGARIEGGALDIPARNWAATAIAVRWSRRASLECLRTNADVKAKVMRRIKVTAAKPRLGTSGSLQDSGSIRGKPCLLRYMRGDAAYDLTLRRRVALQVQQRKQPALERAHTGQTGGGRVLPLALPAGVNDERFLNATEFFRPPLCGEVFSR